MCPICPAFRALLVFFLIFSELKKTLDNWAQANKSLKNHNKKTSNPNGHGWTRWTRFTHKNCPEREGADHWPAPTTPQRG